MKKMQEHVVEGKRVFVGLEDSKRSWKVCVRSGGMIVQEISMPAVYENLQAYFAKRFPGCRIELMYEAGFGGFWLHDRLVADGVQCGNTAAHFDGGEGESGEDGSWRCTSRHAGGIWRVGITGYVRYRIGSCARIVR